jgi:hypothetical protein
MTTDLRVGCRTLTRNSIHTNINDDGTRLDPVAFDELRFANGNNEDIGLFNLM